jgi:hypothetical protein
VGQRDDEHITTPAEFKAWKRYRQLNNRETEALLGLSESTIDKKLNGRTVIQRRMPRQLDCVDRLIYLSFELRMLAEHPALATPARLEGLAEHAIPGHAPEKLRRLIEAKRLR